VTHVEREGKDKIVDVISENTQSVYSNFMASDWSKKVGADRYAGGDIFSSGRYKHPILKIKILFLYRLQLSTDTKKLRTYIIINYFSSSVMLLTSKPLTILRPLQGATLPPLPCATEQVHRCPTSFQCQASGTGLRHQAEEDGPLCWHRRPPCFQEATTSPRLRGGSPGEGGRRVG
jgi:hypothetical protein